MKKDNRVLRIAIAAAFAGSVGAAHAALIAPAGTAFTAAQVASELPTTGINLLSSGAAELTAGSATTPFAPAAGQTLQVNVVLTGGATYATAPVLQCSNTAGASVDTAGGFLPTLGGVGTAQAVFVVSTATMTAGAIGTMVSSCMVSATALTMTTGAHANISMGITFTYGTLASSTVNGNLVEFQPGLTAGVVAGAATTVAQVTSGFMSLNAGATLLSAGTIAWGGDTSAASTAVDLSTKLVLNDVMAAGSGSITVAGASLAATKATAGAFLISNSAGASCAASTPLYTVTGGAASVTFTGVTAADLTAGMPVCLQFTGTTAIPAGSITATLSGVAKTGYSLPSAGPLTVTSITRNGTTLIAPLVNVPSGWISRLVLVNRASSTANYSVTSTSESGNTVSLSGAAASGTLAANGTTVVDLASLVTASGSPRTSLQVVVDGVASNVDGLYQIVNAATGSISNYTLINK